MKMHHDKNHQAKPAKPTSSPLERYTPGNLANVPSKGTMDPSGNTSSNQPLIFRGRLLVFRGGSTGIFPKNDPKFAEDPQVESIIYDHGIMLVCRPVPKITATIGHQLDPPGNAVEGGSV